MAYNIKHKASSAIRVEGTEEQRRKNQAVLQLLQTWRTTDAQEQAETWTIIKSALEEDRLSDRPCFNEYSGLSRKRRKRNFRIWGSVVSGQKTTHRW